VRAAIWCSWRICLGNCARICARLCTAGPAALRSSGFYKDWQGRFGKDVWSLLEGAVGKLA